MEPLNNQPPGAPKRNDGAVSGPADSTLAASPNGISTPNASPGPMGVGDGSQFDPVDAADDHDLRLADAPAQPPQGNAWEFGPFTPPQDPSRGLPSEAIDPALLPDQPLNGPVNGAAGSEGNPINLDGSVVQPPFQGNIDLYQAPAQPAFGAAQLFPGQAQQFPQGNVNVYQAPAQAAIGASQAAPQPAQQLPLRRNNLHRGAAQLARSAAQPAPDKDDKFSFLLLAHPSKLGGPRRNRVCEEPVIGHLALCLLLADTEELLRGVMGLPCGRNPAGRVRDADADSVDRILANAGAMYRDREVEAALRRVGLRVRQGDLAGALRGVRHTRALADYYRNVKGRGQGLRGKRGARVQKAQQDQKKPKKPQGQQQQQQQQPQNPLQQQELQQHHWQQQQLVHRPWAAAFPTPPRASADENPGDLVDLTAGFERISTA